MDMKNLDIRFSFIEEKEDLGDGEFYLHHELNSIQVVGTTLTPEQRSAIAESWAQSDKYWVDICNAIISSLDTNDPIDVE